MRDECLCESVIDTIIQATVYIRGDGRAPWRLVPIAVQDLPRQSEMRKGLLKAIHEANG